MTKRQVVVWSFLAGMILLGCVAFLVFDSDWEDEEFAVYDAIISDSESWEFPPLKSPAVVIQDRTVGRGSVVVGLGELLRGRTADAQYLIKNRRSYSIPDRFTVKAKKIFVSPREVEQRGLGLLDEHPGAHGILILSRVGFNQGKTKAKVYVEFLCGLCGMGGYFYLEKKDHVWKVVNVDSTWMS